MAEPLKDFLPPSLLLSVLESLFGEMLNQAEVMDWSTTFTNPATTIVADAATFIGLASEEAVAEETDYQDLPPDLNLTAFGDQPSPQDMLVPGPSTISARHEFRYELQALSDIIVSLAGFELVKLVINPQTFQLKFNLDESGVTGELRLTLAVRFSKSLLKPMRPLTPPQNEIEYEEDPNLDHAELSLGAVSISVNSAGVVQCQADQESHLDYPVMIGDSGVIVEIDDVALNPDPNNPTFRVGRLKVALPSMFSVPNVDIVITGGLITPQGFSGTVAVDLDLQPTSDGRGFVYAPNTPATLLLVPGGLRHLALSFERNVLTAADINGSLIIPYFNEPVDIGVMISSAGAFEFTLLGEIAVEKKELLAANLRALSIKRDNDLARVIVSGSLEPLLMSSDGMQWPKLDVTDLSIDSYGKFSIKEAWLDLKDLATLDLWGFHFELRRIGLGSSGDKLWIDLSGGLRLIEQIPAALDVEGFRLTWPQNLLANIASPTIVEIQDAVKDIAVEFAGINLSFGIPDTLEFDGLIRFFKKPELVGFAGDVALRVPAAGFAAEAGLMVGLSFEPLFPFLYVYFGVELPAGIPLGQSGLALKGALGMFGLNVKPAKEEDQNWYYDWYKREPVGAHPTNKWEAAANSLALGVGVTITTADGHVKGTRGLLVLSIPGPILIIEGRALILSGLSPNSEPPLRALAVFDGNAGTVQFNVEAEASLIKDLFNVYGMLEAFFDFNDITNWHLYLGQNSPRDRRIRADILKLGNSFLFNADAYLMMDMIGAQTLRSRMGASIAFEPKVPPIDPVSIVLTATLEGDGTITARPEQFSSELDLSAHLRLSAFGQSLRLSADANFLTEGVQPLKVGARLHVEAEMPGPIDPVEGNIEFEWEQPRVPAVESPLSEIDVSSRFVPDRVTPADGSQGPPFPILSSVRGTGRSQAESSPIVPVDSQPIIGFKHTMNSEVATLARNPDGVDHHYDVGIFQFHPWLMQIELFEHPKGVAWNEDGTDNWALIASTNPNRNKPLPGTWLTESQPQSPQAPSPRRLQLWTDNPWSSSSRTLSRSHSLAARLRDDYPDDLKCDHDKASPVCVDFTAAGKMTIEPGESREYRGILFEPTMRGAYVHQACLMVDGYLNIQFRQRVCEVHIFFCQSPKLSDTDFEKRLSAHRGMSSLDELRAMKKAGIKVNDLRACDSDAAYTLTVTGDVWRLSSSAGFDCLHISQMGQFGISSICYVTLAEVERSARAVQQCENSLNSSSLIRWNTYQTLQPGAYYRLNITTRVDGELHFEDLPFSRNSYIGQLLVLAYEELADALVKDLDDVHNQVCFFQTEGPPVNLRPYVKWCYPENQSDRFFYRDDIKVRFLRPHLEKMFDSPFTLKLQIKDTQGNPVDIYDTSWEKSQSATLFPEESVWEIHRKDLNWTPRPIPKDDVLLAKLKPGATPDLLPRSRYQLEIVRVEGPPEQQLFWYFEVHYGGTDNRVTNIFDSTESAVAVNYMVRVALSNFQSIQGRSFSSLDLAEADRRARWPSAETISIPDSLTPVLYSSSFITSAFAGFEELVHSYSGTPKVIKAKTSALITSLLQAVTTSSAAFAKARLDWEHAQIDYRFEDINGGKKGLEDARVKHREAASIHDENFRALAEKLSEIYYQPFAETLELFLVTDPTGRRPVCAWFRSPESLDPRLSALQNPSNPQSEIVDHVGRTEFTLLRHGVKPPLSISVLPTVDGTQILIFPPTGQRWGAGKYTFKLKYFRDYGDEQEDGDFEHRYDRPVTSTDEDTGPVFGEIAWQWQ